jgi:opacity protein-like surface antigen
MKKFATILVVFAFVSMLPYSASAQIKMSAGLKAGLSMANWSGADAKPTTMGLSPLFAYSTRTGFTGYGFLGIQFINLIGAQVEVGYSMKGTKVKGAETRVGQNNNIIPITIDGTMAFDYLEIPILVKLCLPVPVINPYIYAGPSIGMLLSAKFNVKATGSDGGQTISSDTTVDVKENINSTDVGLAFGAGVDLPFGLLIDLRYTLGLGTIAKQETGSSTTPDVKNGVFAIMAGWGFKL